MSDPLVAIIKRLSLEQVALAAHGLCPWCERPIRGWTAPTGFTRPEVRWPVDLGEDGYPGPVPNKTRCGGADPDLCLNEMCEACVTRCHECRNATCAEHLKQYKGDSLCELCCENRKKEDAEERASELRVAQSIKRITGIA